MGHGVEERASIDGNTKVEHDGQIRMMELRECRELVAELGQVFLIKQIAVNLLEDDDLATAQPIAREGNRGHAIVIQVLDNFESAVGR